MAISAKIVDRTCEFALQIVRIIRALPDDYASQAGGRQMPRSGTSLGAKVEEAIGASSKKDFANKLAIARKVARETHYYRHAQKLGRCSRITMHQL